MKIFYTASYAFRQNNNELYNKTVKILQQIFGKNNVFYANDELDVTFGAEKTGDILSASKYRQDALKDSDIIIADVTKGSTGIGYNISAAISLKKPVLVLRKKGKDKSVVHHPIDSGKIRNLIYKEYENTTDIKKFIETFREDAHNIMDTKFILIIPAEIDRYMEWASDYKRMHKAQVVRTAIEEYMEKDQDWKEYLQDEG